MRLSLFLSSLAITVVSLLVLANAVATPAENADDEPEPNQPDQLNSNAQAVEERLAQILSTRLDFVDLSYVSPGDSDLQGGWRANYNWSYQHRGGEGFTLENGTTKMRNTSFGVKIDGSYSFGETANTEDYSRAVVDFGLERGGFGAIRKLSPDDQDKFEKCLADKELSDSNGTAWCFEMAQIDQYIPDGTESFYLSTKLHFSVETDQDFAARNEAFGVSAALARGKWPAVSVTLERVDPRNDPTRVTVDGAGQFLRLAYRLDYKRNLENVVGSPIWLFLRYQRFEELSPSTAIQEADMHESEFFSAALRIPARSLIDSPRSDATMLFVRYTMGDLPFDAVSESAVQIGLSHNLDDLVSLLAR